MKQDINRRGFLAGSAATLATAAMSGIVAPQAFGAESKAEFKRDKKLVAIVDKALDCINAGEVCAAHCQFVIKQGDTTLADCLASTQDMLAVCGAIVRVAAQQSAGNGLTKQLAQTCAAFCDACAEQCKKHQDHHRECKACLKACQECSDACKSFG